MTKQTSGVLWIRHAGSCVAALAMLAGCPLEDDDTTDSGAASSTGDPSPASSGDPSTSSDEPSTSGEASSGSSGAGTVPWGDVECDESMCNGSEVCVAPGPYCTGKCVDNYQTLVYPPSVCEPFPEHCDPQNPGQCLIEEYCGLASEGGFGNGSLWCEGALDCYCR